MEEELEQHLWTTKSGDLVWVSEMTDSHVLNTYKMLGNDIRDTERSK